MNRFLTRFNLFGVIVLAVLCAAQWQANRQVNLEATGLEKKQLEQQEKLQVQEKTLKGYVADLDHFREQLAHANVALKGSEEKLVAAEHEGKQLTLERDQLKASVTNWAAAVSARNEQLKTANSQLQKLASERDEAIVKFNELAEKYNSVVKDLNEARAKPPAESPAK